MSLPSALSNCDYTASFVTDIPDTIIFASDEYADLSSCVSAAQKLFNDIGLTEVVELVIYYCHEIDYCRIRGTVAFSWPVTLDEFNERNLGVIGLQCVQSARDRDACIKSWPETAQMLTKHSVAPRP